MTRLDALSLGVSIGAIIALVVTITPAHLPVSIAAELLLAFTR